MEQSLEQETKFYFLVRLNNKHHFDALLMFVLIDILILLFQKTLFFDHHSMILIIPNLIE